jgi:hypothetical protein
MNTNPLTTAATINKMYIKGYKQGYKFYEYNEQAIEPENLNIEYWRNWIAGFRDGKAAHQMNLPATY